jgi:serine/threonine protein kinase
MYGKVNNKTDVYSFGVVLLELITGRTPIDNSRPKGQENLVTSARPLLEKRNLEKLVDPRLQVRKLYDLNEMENMVLAASLCVQSSAPRRPSMRQVLKILHGDRSVDLPILQRHEAKVSLDLDELECTLSNKGGEGDMQSYMALAMLGVDDDITSQSSTDLTHSNMFLEQYMEDRFSRSSSF